MSFDALTILGVSAVVLCGGFLIALVNRNDAGGRASKRLAGSDRNSPADSRL